MAPVATQLQWVHDPVGTRAFPYRLDRPGESGRPPGRGGFELGRTCLRVRGTARRSGPFRRSDPGCKPLGAHSPAHREDTLPRMREVIKRAYELLPLVMCVRGHSAVPRPLPGVVGVRSRIPRRVGSRARQGRSAPRTRTLSRSRRYWSWGAGPGGGGGTRRHEAGDGGTDEGRGGDGRAEGSQGGRGQGGRGQVEEAERDEAERQEGRARGNRSRGRRPPRFPSTARATPSTPCRTAPVPRTPAPCSPSTRALSPVPHPP